MSRTRSGMATNPLAIGAEWLASIEALPTSVRAVFGYYADTGVFDLRALTVKSHVDAQMDAIFEEAFTMIESALAAEFEVDSIEFSYETKLTLPARLTLGYLYRRILEDSTGDSNPFTGRSSSGWLGRSRLLGDGRRSVDHSEATRELVDRVDRANRITALIVEALIDGDMRDALNDDEFEDFVVDITLDDLEDQRRIAEVAQSTLKQSIDRRFETFPAAVREAHHRAVEISEAHQDRDEGFRALIDREDRESAIRTEYKSTAFDDPPALFDAEILDLPYFKTQYDRVGVIYDGMIDMYRGAGFAINDDFKRSIILAIIGAQIWLDDVSDYADDLEEGQLTPVTAEYLLADRDSEAHERVVTIAETYLDYAKRYATASDTPMTGIAVEYIYRDGKPDHLPR